MRGEIGLLERGIGAVLVMAVVLAIQRDRYGDERKKGAQDLPSVFVVGGHVSGQVSLAVNDPVAGRTLDGDPSALGEGECVCWEQKTYF
jgi:hypothetical protein